MGRFIELFRAVDAAPKPSVVVLQEIGGHSDSAAHCGEVMATFLMRLGAIGLVSDCAVRDLAEVHALGFHYFARGSVASHANFRIVRSGVPVHVLGMVAHTGDLLHGDVNGVLSIPKIDVERLAEKVDLIRARERRLMEFVRGSDFSLDRVLEVAE